MHPVTWHDHEVQRSVSIRPMVGLVFIAIAIAGPVTAQTASRRTVWDGVYTEAQAVRGQNAFGQNCAGCHSLATEGKSPLAGEPFWKSFAQKNVGELLDYISANMPNGRPGSLDEGTYADIVAAILKSNDFPAGTSEIARETVARVLIVPKDGSSELPANAFVRVVGCLTRSGADWVITRATTPERAERVPASGEDAARSLGGRTMPLKFVVTRLDPLVDSRIVATGLQIGAGGADGLNVTTVSRVASSCP